MKYWLTIALAGALTFSILSLGCGSSTDEESQSSVEAAEAEASLKEARTRRLGLYLSEQIDDVYQAVHDYVYDDESEDRITREYQEVNELCEDVGRFTANPSLGETSTTLYRGADWGRYEKICLRFEIISDGTYGDMLDKLPDLREDLVEVLP